MRKCPVVVWSVTILESLHGTIQVERLSAYAPELNPAEYVRAYLEQHELPHFCAEDFAHLTTVARRRPASMQRRTTLVFASWKKAELPLWQLHQLCKVR